MICEICGGYTEINRLCETCYAREQAGNQLDEDS